jgi:hypothetical protein
MSGHSSTALICARVGKNNYARHNRTEKFKDCERGFPINIKLDILKKNVAIITS